MRFKNWVRSLGQSNGPRRPSILSRLFVLEDRTVPATFTVTTPIDVVNANDGLLSLREAVTAANADGIADTIVFAGAARGETITLSATGGTQFGPNALEVTGDTTIRGSGEKLTRDAAGPDMRLVFVGTTGTLTVSGLTLTNGLAGGGTGALGAGGAVYNKGTLALSNAALSGNKAQGGVGQTGGNNPGGDGRGGAVYNDAGTVTLTNVTLFSNTADGGNGKGSGADGVGSGGAVFSRRGTVTINNSTLTGNTADAGRGFSSTDDGGAKAVVVVNNSIFGQADAGATDFDGNGTHSGTNNLIRVNGSFPAAGVVSTADPLLSADARSSASGTAVFPPLAGSPAIDAGKSAAVPTGIPSDQRGAPFVRVAGVAVDIGAVEVQTVANLTLVVDNTTDISDGDYSAGQLSLREANRLANGSVGPDAITFAPALAGKTITFTKGDFDIVESVTITGPAGGITIDANAASRVLEIDDKSAAVQVVALANLTLTNGKSVGNGGGILSLEDLTLTNVTVTGNAAVNGGGVSSAGKLTVTDSTITGNTAAGNGGGIDFARGTAAVTNTTVSKNTASAYGGGLIFDTDTVTATLTGVTVSGNTAGAGGGGVWTRATDFSLSASTVTGNTANFAGGVYVYDQSAVIDATTISNNTSADRVGGVFVNGGATLTMTNSTVSGNVAGGGGGGGLRLYGTAVVSDSTVSGNSAAGYGGGIQNNGDLTATNLTITGNRSDSDDDGGQNGGGLATRTGIVTVTNTIIAGNFIGSGTTPNDVRAKIDAGTNNLIGDVNSAGGFTNNVNGNRVGVAVNTVLNTTLADNGGPTFTHALIPGSPAIGAATVTGAAAKDQRGFLRPAAKDLPPDIGSYELQLVTIDPMLVLPNGRVGSAYSQTLTAASAGLPADTEFAFALVGTLPAGLTLSPQGVVSGKPTTVGTGQFTAFVTAATGDFAGSTFSVVIDKANTAPVATDDKVTAITAAAIMISVLANDTDTDGDALTVTSIGSAAKGAVVTDGKTVTYTSINQFTGTDTFTYTISDKFGGTATGTVTVTVTPPNNPPVAVGDTATTAVATPIRVNVLANDTDADGDALTVTATTVPANGKLAVTAGRTITYTPNAGFAGADSFTYTIGDGNGGTATATVTVTVAPATGNSPPVAVNDTATTTAGTAKTVSVLANDTDANNDPLTVVAVGTAANGKATINTGLTVTYTPNAGFTGTDTFTYTINDGNGGAATGTVSVTVTAAPTSPVELVGFREFGVGADRGTQPTAALFNPDGSVRYTVTAFDSTFTGGVRTAAADFNGDGVADLVVGTGPGRATRVRILDGKSQAELFGVDPFEAAFTGGVFVTTGDLNGDGRPELIVTPDEGGGPRVDVYSGNGFGKTASFFGIDDPNFRGGARAATGDLNADGRTDLIVVAGFGGGPRVAAFDGKSVGGTPARLFGDFFAFEQTLRNGVFVTAGDLDADGTADLIAGGGPGGGPRVTVFGGKALLTNVQTPLANFFAGNESNRGGVRMTVKNLDGDDRADLVVGDGTAAGSRVTAFRGRDITAAGTPATELSFDAFAGFTGGVFVG